MKTILVMGAAVLAGLAACEEKKAAPVAPKPAATGHTGHDHHGGAVIELGTAKVGPFDVKATRDEGQIVAGKDAPIDVTVTGGKVSAVRFWIGTEDAKGSVKAKADVEDPKEPDRWHTHAEIPSPIPEGSKLWVEIEDDAGVKHTGSFELKA